jgi:hypothetical protein
MATKYGSIKIDSITNSDGNFLKISDVFNKTYGPSFLGSSDEEPTERPDGSELSNDDIFFDLSTKSFKIFNKEDNEWVIATNSFTLISNINSDTDAIIGGKYYCDSSDGTFKIKLPAEPIEGSRIFVFDINNSFNDNPVTLEGNGNNIMGNDENYSLDISNKYYTVEYVGNNDWRVY